MGKGVKKTFYEKPDSFVEELTVGGVREKKADMNPSPMSEKRKRYHIEFDIDVPGDARPAQVENWIRRRCGDKGKLRRDNPLYAETVDPIYGTFKATPRRKASKNHTRGE